MAEARCIGCCKDHEDVVLQHVCPECVTRLRVEDVTKRCFACGSTDAVLAGLCACDECISYIAGKSALKWKAEVTQAGIDKLRRGNRPLEVHFSLNPLEAGMMLGLVAQQLHMKSESDTQEDPFRKTLIRNTWTKLTNDLRDWQEAEE